uniref:Uncharacterized protein MANES_05G054600 n=1 Tax=Rhizophora mucronata TaxID=61149 RepID=A0A2P2LLM0_RHIMU
MAKRSADSRSNRAAVQATNDDASASKLCVIFSHFLTSYSSYYLRFPILDIIRKPFR